MKRPKHLAFIRTLPCLCCGDNITVEAAHVRYADARVGKPITGMGTKPDDAFCLPLCNSHHRQQHEVGNERVFWAKYGIDPILISLALFRVSGDHEVGEQIVHASRS